MYIQLVIAYCSTLMRELITVLVWYNFVFFHWKLHMHLFLIFDNGKIVQEIIDLHKKF